MDMEVKEGSSILNNIQAEESKKQRSQRKRKPQENQYKNFLEFEEVIFGDILEEEEADEISEISEDNKKKQKKKTNKLKDTFKVHKNGKAAEDQKNEDNLIEKEEEEEVIVPKMPRKKKANIIEEENYVNIVEGIDTVMNLSELKDKKTGYTNSDMILMILEICLNAKKYGITSSNNTRKFWDEVYEKEEWENFLLTFKPETLRKYWRILRDTNDYKKIIDTVQSHAIDLNYPGVKYRIILTQ
jgi:hypothetical protein